MRRFNYTDCMDRSALKVKKVDGGDLGRPNGCYREILAKYLDAQINVFCKQTDDVVSYVLVHLFCFDYFFSILSFDVHYI